MLWEHAYTNIFMKNLKVISLKQFSCCIKSLGVSKILDAFIWSKVLKNTLALPSQE